MPFCTECGQASPETAKFCPECGAQRTPAAAADRPVPGPDTGQDTGSETRPLASEAPRSTRTLPPPAAATATSTTGPVVPRIDLGRLLVGNWLGAGAVALAALLTSGLLSVVVALLGKPTDFGLDNSLTLVAVLMTGAFGADLTAEADVLGLEAQASVGAFPLTLTIAALAVAVLVFRRVTAGYTSALDALADAARAAVVFGLGLMLVALVFRSDSREFGRGWGADLASMFDTRLALSADAAGAFGLGFLLLFVVLAGSCLVRGGWWPAPVERVRDWVAAPLYGVGVLGLLLPVVGLVGLGLLMISGDAVEEATDASGEDLRISIAMILAMLASGGTWLLGLGAGGSFGTRGGGDDGRVDDLHHLAHFTEESPGLWAAPVVMLLVLATLTYLVARRAPAGRLLPTLAGWVLTVLVVTPFLVRVSGIHAQIEGEAGGQGFDQWGWIGLLGWQSTLLLTLVALLVSLLLGWRAGVLTGVASRARELGQRVQSDPSRPATAPEQPQG